MLNSKLVYLKLKEHKNNFYVISVGFTNYYPICQEKLAYAKIKIKRIIQNADKSTTQSQLLRQQIYKNWDQTEKTINFEEYYQEEMKKIIHNYKENTEK